MVSYTILLYSPICLLNIQTPVFDPADGSAAISQVSLITLLLFKATASDLEVCVNAANGHQWC